MFASLAFAQKLKRRFIESLLSLVAKKNNLIYVDVIKSMLLDKFDSTCYVCI